jgi:cyclic pyranopterin phosphate synthase
VNAFEVVSVNISLTKGTAKTPVSAITLRPDHGVEGDAHAGPGLRQVSLLAEESIARMRDRHPGLKPGAFAENITTRGVVLYALPVGTELTIGEAVLEITQIGKVCHTGCAVARTAGTCVMPTEGVFARVIKGGTIHAAHRGHYRIRPGLTGPV